MTVVWLKIIVAVLVFGVAILGGLLVGRAQEGSRSAGVLHYGEYFAHGVFLGASLLHLLPEAMADFSLVYPQINYPVILLICVWSIFAIQFIESGVLSRFQHNKLATIPWLSYTLMVLLSIHSVIAGIALGVGDSTLHVAIIFIAIISHKGAAAFALAMTMRRAGVSTTISRKVMFLFAIMTPLGIAFGSMLNAILASINGLLFEAIFGAIAAGTFLTVAFGHHGIHHDHHEHDFAQLGFLGLGILLMAVIAVVL